MLSLSVCGVKAAIHIDERGVIWLNLSQLMKLVGKTKKQVSVFALCTSKASKLSTQLMKLVGKTKKQV